MDINVARRPLAIGLAAGVLGTAAVASLAFTGHPAATARTAQPSAAAAVMPAMAASSAASRPSTGTVALLTEAQVRAIAERIAGGPAEQVVRGSAASGQSYSVWVDGANGTDAKLVIDARTGKVLSSVTDPQDSPDPADPQDSPDPADPQDSPDAGQADPGATQAPDPQDSSGD